MGGSLLRLPELARNILWSWEPSIRAIFRRMDPTLWRDCGYNPVLMLGRVSQATLEKLAGGLNALIEAAHLNEHPARFFFEDKSTPDE